MAKGDTRNTIGTSQNLISGNQATGMGLLNTIMPAYGQTFGAAQAMLPYLGPGFMDLAETGGYDPSVLGGLRSDYGQIQGGLSDLLGTVGGFQPARFPDEEAWYLSGQGQQQVASGGYDADQLADLQERYRNVVATGGISPEAEEAMRRQATRGVSGVYGSAMNRARQVGAASGSPGGSTAAAISRMARQAAQSGSEAITGVNAQLAGLRQQGTLAGLQGMSALSSDVAGGRRAALGQYASTRGMITAADQAAQNQLLQSYGLGGSLLGQQGNLMGQYGGLLSDVASRRLAGMSGLSNLYGTTAGLSSDLLGRGISAYGTMGGITSDQLRVLAGLSTQPGFGTNLLNAITGIGSAAGSFMGGLGGLARFLGR